MKESSPPGGRILFFWTEETAKIEEKMEKLGRIGKNREGSFTGQKGQATPQMGAFLIPSVKQISLTQVEH